MPYGDYTEENNFGELSGCETNTEGPKSIGRPAVFCSTVSCQDAVTILGPTEIVPAAITVGGQTFVPMDVDLVVGITGGGGSISEKGGTISPPTAITQTFTLLVAQS